MKLVYVGAWCSTIVPHCGRIIPWFPSFLLYRRRNRPTSSTALTPSHPESPVALAAVDEVGAGSREHGDTDPGEIAAQPTVTVTESCVTTSQPRTDLGQQPNVYDYIIDPENASGAFVINRKPPSEGHYLNQHIQPPVAPTATVRLQSGPAGPGESSVESGSRAFAPGEGYLTPVHADSDSEFTSEDSTTGAVQWPLDGQDVTPASPRLQGYLQLHN